MVDHKSKSAATLNKDLPSYRRQLYIYAAYVMDRWGEYPHFLRFNLFRENSWVTEEFSLDAYEETLRWTADTIRQILETKDWPAFPSSYFCRFICGVLDACPAKDAVLYPKPST